MNINKKAFTLIELIIVIAIIVILAAISKPNFCKRPRPETRQKACFSNIRVLQGAVEMYNMDVGYNDNNETKKKEVVKEENMMGIMKEVKEESMMKELDIDQLIKGKYLREHPYKPDNSCSYISIGDLSEDGVVACEYHGDIEQKYIKSKMTY